MLKKPTIAKKAVTIAKKSTPVLLDSEILLNWTTLNAHLSTLDEDSALRLLEKEKATKKRRQFMLRLFGRFAKLRDEREREEYVLAEPVGRHG